MDPVRVRFAPSPTGMLHIGGLRTALFNWLWARKNNGKFFLRIEDTDQTRLVKNAENNIIDALKWYGLDYDAFDGKSIVHQSERKELYQDKSRELISKGWAYYCFCSKAELKEQRELGEKYTVTYNEDKCCKENKEVAQEKVDSGEQHVIRLKIPRDRGSISFRDEVYGTIGIQPKYLDDQILIKSDGFPTYHLANVVDDIAMGITHVIRAEEWLPSTPKHVLLYEAFGLSEEERPKFVHLPMVLGPDKTKLSKRHGAKAALDYKKDYFPQAIINFIALLGWNPKNEKELFTIDELKDQFELNKINKASAVFNVEKLDWLNGQYAKNEFRGAAIEARVKVLKNRYGTDNIKLNMKHLRGTAKLEIDRIKTFSDPSEIADYTLSDVGDYSADMLIPKGESADSTLKVLKKVNDYIGNVMGEHTYEKVELLRDDIVQWIKDQGLSNKQVLWPLRVALTGKEKSPDVFDMIHYWEKEKVLELISRAIKNLQKS